MPGGRTTKNSNKVAPPAGDNDKLVSTGPSIGKTRGRKPKEISNMSKKSENTLEACWGREAEKPKDETEKRIPLTEEKQQKPREEERPEHASDTETDNSDDSADTVVLETTEEVIDEVTVFRPPSTVARTPGKSRTAEVLGTTAKKPTAPATMSLPETVGGRTTTDDKTCHGNEYTKDNSTDEIQNLVSWCHNWADTQQETWDSRMADLENLIRSEVSKLAGTRFGTPEHTVCQGCEAKDARIKQLEELLSHRCSDIEKLQWDACKWRDMLERDHEITNDLSAQLKDTRTEKLAWKQRALEAEAEGSVLKERINAITQHGTPQETRHDRHDSTAQETRRTQSPADGATLAHGTNVPGGLGAPEANDTRRPNVRTVAKPESLTREQWEAELEDRRKRKKNIIIRGLPLTSRDKKAEIQEWAKNALGVKIRVNNLERVGINGLIAQVDEWRQKLEVMRAKGKLEEMGQRISISDDYTFRQRDVKRWIERQVEIWKESGIEVRAGYQKIWRQGTWLEWDEMAGALKPQTQNGSPMDKEHEATENQQYFRPTGYENVRKNRSLWTEADVILIQETFLEDKSTEKTLKQLDKNYHWTTKAASRKHKRGRGSGGHLVGVRKDIEAEWEVVVWSHGISLIIKNTLTNEKYTIISGYNPDRKLLKQFLEALDTQLEIAEKDSSGIIISGDLNAKIETQQGIAESGRNTEHTIPDRKSEDKDLRPEGKHLVEWCEERALLIMNGRAKGDEEGKFTAVTYGHGIGSVLDYVIVRLDDTEAPDWFKNMKIAAQEGSDHLPIFYNIDWNDKKSTKPEFKRTIKKRRLRWKPTNEAKFQKIWTEKWQAQEVPDTENTEERWGKFIRTIEEAAKASGMTTGGKSWNPDTAGSWDTGEYKVRRRKLFKLLHKYRKVKDWNSKVAYLKCRRELKELRETLISNWIDGKRREVKNSKNITEWWKAMRWFRKKKRVIASKVSKEEWMDHFMNLLEGHRDVPEAGPEAQDPKQGTNVHPTEEKADEDRDGSPDAEIHRAPENEGARYNVSPETESETEHPLNEPLKTEEIGEAIRNLKAGKAAGEDGITAKFIKALPRAGIEELVEVIKTLWQKGKIVDRWCTATILPIHKKGNDEEAKNYRGISLLDLGYKILATVMAKRLSKWLDKEKKLSEAQAGFRSNRSTMEQAFILNSLIGRKLRFKNGKLYVAFVDFKAAFDKVSREKLWEKMKKKGIQGKFLEMTQEIYKRTSNTVSTGEDKSDEFHTSRGVRQGCPLSPDLFNIYIDNLEEEIRNKGNGGTRLRTGSKFKVYTLLYADDAALIAESAEELARMLRTLEDWADSNEMEVSTEKTKIMIFRRGGRRKREAWKYKKQEIEVVNKFKYLGFWFTTRNQYNTHVSKTAGKTQLMINKVWGETKRAAVSKLKTKLFFMDATVKAAALYGAEIWGWKKRPQAERIQSRYVKGSLGISKTTPDYIWKLETGRHSVEIEARKRAGKFIGKVIEMEDSRWAKRCLQEEIRSLVDKNPTRWARELQEAMEKTGDGSIITNLTQGTSRIPIEERLEELNKVAADQETQECWSRATKSSYCNYFTRLKKAPGIEDYWDSDDLKTWHKETWTRWRCGSVAIEQKQGYQDNKCRVCRAEVETLQHTIHCKELMKEMTPADRKWWTEWSEASTDEEIREKLLKLLENPPEKELCNRLARVEKILVKHEIYIYENAKNRKIKLLKTQLSAGKRDTRGDEPAAAQRCRTSDPAVAGFSIRISGLITTVI